MAALSASYALLKWPANPFVFLCLYCSGVSIHDRGFGFVQFEREEDAKKAANSENGSLLKGSKLGKYSKCSKILNTFLFLFSNKILVIEIHIILVRTAHREDLLQKQSDLGLHCLSRHLGWATSVQNFRSSIEMINLQKYK